MSPLGVSRKGQPWIGQLSSESCSRGSIRVSGGCACSVLNVQTSAGLSAAWFLICDAIEGDTESVFHLSLDQRV